MILAALLLAAAEPLELETIELTWPDGSAAARSAEVEAVSAERNPFSITRTTSLVLRETRNQADALAAGSAAHVRWLQSLMAASAPGECDGVVILYAGGMGRRGGALWPQQGVVPIGERSVPFVMVPADDGSGWTAGVLVHELGHVRGLREHDADVPNTLCPMAGDYHEGEAVAAEPAEFCAPCRVRMGWVEPQPLVSGTAPAEGVASLRLGLGRSLVLDEERRVWMVRGSDAEYVGDAPLTTRWFEVAADGTVTTAGVHSRTLDGSEGRHGVVIGSNP